MRLELARFGGLSSIADVVSIDTRDLSPETAQELADLVSRIDRPAIAGQSPPVRWSGADDFHYELTVTPDDRPPYAVSIQESELTPQFRSLIERLLAMRRRR
ncbi:MAG TPA: protealysin inhibitor emfourin [Nitriliruptorales bacterium]|nr:protealysin inhibitor emfourin [Nitriliruptorales bacterium]